MVQTKPLLCECKRMGGVWYICDLCVNQVKVTINDCFLDAIHWLKRNFVVAQTLHTESECTTIALRNMDRIIKLLTEADDAR